MQRVKVAPADRLHQPFGPAASADDVGEGIAHRDHGPDHGRAWGLITEDTPGFYARARLGWLRNRATELESATAKRSHRVAVALDVPGSLNGPEFRELVAIAEARKGRKKLSNSPFLSRTMRNRA